jgi:hypothetical protein
LPGQVSRQSLSLLVAHLADFRKRFQVGTVEQGWRRDGGVKAFQGIHWLSSYLIKVDFRWQIATRMLIIAG